MRVAIPVYENHIATVGDFADTLTLIDIQDGKEISRKSVQFSPWITPAKVGILSEHSVDVLICGAVSRPFAAMVMHSGIELIPFISGSVEEVLSAYLRGKLADPRFFMPGHSRGMRWCSRGRCRRRNQISRQ